MTTSTPFRINLALGAGLLTVVLVAVAAYITIEKLVEDAKDVVRSQQSFTVLEQFGRTLQAAESAQRKFLLVPDEFELRNYQQAVAEVRLVLNRLEMADDSADTKNHLRAFAGSVNRRLTMLEDAVKARQRQGLDAAIAIVDGDINRQLRDEIESLSDTLGTRRMRQLAQSQSVNSKSAQIVEALIVGGALLSLLLIAGAIRSINHYHAVRREAEAKLSDSEAKARAVADSMVEGVVTTEVSGEIIEANPAALKLFGYPREQLLGQHVTHLMPERFRSQFEFLLDDLRARKDGFSEAGREVLAMRADGSEFPVTVSFGDVKVGGQRLFSAIVHDITESTRIADALQASEAQLRQITDAVPALIAYLDREGRYLFHNKAYSDTFGLRPGQILGKTLQQVLGDKLYQDIKPRVEQVLAGQAVSYERTQHTALFGDREYAVSYVPQYDVMGDAPARVTGFFAMATDITEMKRMDRMKSEFVSTVSHELRTPLTSIRGSLGLIAGGVAGALPPAVQGLVEIAKNNCERLIRLINDILDIEKIESGQMRMELQALALQTLVRQAITANEGFAAQHVVSLELQAPDQEVWVRVDNDRVMQVLTNLLSNAVKFSPRGMAVEIAVVARAGQARVEVRDHGPGIPKEFRQRIFQKFSQADSSDTRQKGGTGLGLNISKAIIDRLGGSIGFGAAPGGGTIFYFELPCAALPAPAAVVPVLASATAASGPARPRILVCEDDRDVARLIGMMLEKAGFEADLAHSADEALARLAAQPYAAMTVDLTLLPEQDGAALITAVRRDPRTTELPIVVISLSADQARKQAGHEALRVAEWIEKPINEQLMVRSLRGAIRGGSGGRPRILHVEDDLDIQRIAAAITQEFASFEFAASVQEARTCLRERTFDLVLLDLTLPGGSGWDLFADIDLLQPRPPVVVFSATDVRPAEDRGAAAILVKAQTSNEELLATIQRVLKMAPAQPDAQET